MKFKKFIMLIIILVTGFCFATNDLNPRAMGSSWSNGMLLHNSDAARYNPALLSFTNNSSNKQYELSLFSFGISFENSFSRSYYEDYVADGGDNSWSSSDVDDILDVIDDDWRIQNNIKVGLVGISFGSSALGLSFYSTQDLNIPKALLELPLKGNEVGKEYKLDNLDGEILNMYSAEYSFSDKLDFKILNKFFQEFTLGGTLRYMYGAPIAEMDDLDGDSDGKIKPAYMKIDNVTGRLLVNDLNSSSSPADSATILTGQMDFLVSEGGQGIGLDFGFAGKINDNISVGLSVTNLISGMSWTKNNKIYRYDYKIRGMITQDLGDADSDSIFTSNLDTTFTSIDTKAADKFFTSLPAELNLGFAWKFDSKTQYITWTAAYNQGFTDQHTATTMPKFSTGFEWSHYNADWFKFRGGITGGGDALYSSACGFSLAFSNYAFDLGVENKYLYGNGSKGLGVSIGQRIYW